MAETCPIDGCQDCVAFGRADLLCRAHWKMVPREMQLAVYNAWRGSPTEDHRGSEAYMTACQAAIEHVNARIGQFVKSEIPDPNSEIP